MWVRENYTLLLDGEVIKQIGRPNQAIPQITILGTFQDDGWPNRIDDPLPRPPGDVDSRRLGEAVRSLNRGLTHITFYRDGTGEGICWRFAAENPAESDQ